MMKVFHTVLFYAILFVSTVLMGSVAILSAFLNPKWPHVIAKAWGRINMWAAGVKVRVDGLENLDRAQTYVFTANHQGWFDIFAMLGHQPMVFSWLAKEELFKIPVLGRAMYAAGYIPIDRSDSRKALVSMNNAAEKIQSGTSVFIFPEGTRSADGLMRDFKKGGFILAIKSHQPVLPVSISGSYRILRKESRMINPGTIRIVFGKPVPTEGMDLKSRDALMERVRNAIKDHLTPEEAGPESAGEARPAASV
jgi:1-acyl-sn-glycerol-3-phosphate acyltransferase